MLGAVQSSSSSPKHPLHSARPVAARRLPRPGGRLTSKWKSGRRGAAPCPDPAAGVGVGPRGLLAARALEATAVGLSDAPVGGGPGRVHAIAQRVAGSRGLRILPRVRPCWLNSPSFPHSHAGIYLPSPSQRPNLGVHPCPLLLPVT